MSRSLYCLYDPGVGGLTFGVKPYADKDLYWGDYGRMSRRISLKGDLGWREVEHLQNILRKADIWADFPTKGYTLVNAEFKAGDEEQRIDILYIRDDGALLPCELKIGGESKDAHGQLIRYIADLHFQKLDLAWVRAQHERFLDSITDPMARGLHENKFNDFITTNAVSDRFVRILPRTGILIDEGFPSQCLKAVRYLNGNCGFAIRLIQLDAYVLDDWDSSKTDYMYRVDFTDVQ